jgi:hypothetical protein
VGTKAIAISRLCADQPAQPTDPVPTPDDPKPIDGTLKHKATKPPGGGL